MFNYLKNSKYTSKKINKIYSQYLYTGFHGFLMRYCHRQLECKLPNKNFKKILEIGAGSEPHYKYIDNKNFSYFILEKVKYKKNNKNKSKIFYKYYDGKKIPFKANTFDRIILSHTLEHIPSPESFINDTMKVLKKGGVLSISLPADPGIFYRLCRTFNKVFAFNRKLKISALEYDYSNAIEHINSIYNLVNIIRHNYKNKIKESFLPFKIKIIDINLFYNVHITK
ncbi:class I SAM-dependent methyltransferase [Pelagibacteraceae bacterium]|jgi:phosphatidylethanolamine/phosphatidyl-N-methylethanolamine N-methyltransferase|nr:class I SAM-dependent methyltransferase [Pelagibacteraceae bacterium]